MQPRSGNRASYVHGALELFEELADLEAIVGGGRRLTYRQLRQDVLDLAAALADHGVRSGSAVLVMMSNSVSGPVLQLALHLLGCRSMWIASVTARREIMQFAELAAPDVFVYDPAAPNQLGGEISAALPGIPVLCMGAGGAGPDLTAPRPPGAPAWSLDTPTAEPESFLQTSGTTGTPKLVHHKHGFYAQILELGRQFRAAGFPVLRHLSHSPMWLASGQMTGLFNLFTGGVLFLREDWDPAAFLRVVEAERLNSTFLTPPMLYEVLDHPDCETADFSSMFMFNVGAGPASPARLRQAIARFGPVLRIVYGLSEAVVITALPNLTDDPEHPERLRSCGTPFGDVRIQIRDTAELARPTGTEPPVPTGQTGEVWVHSRLSFSGYFGQPELTAATIVEGWVRTRDLGYLDDDGYLYLVDRVHDMIVTTRRNWAIFCRPIEDALAEHPEVRAAAVIGVPDEIVGEVPHAFVVTTEGARVNEAELIELVGETLNEMWAPHSVEFVAALPRNRSAKVDKQALRAAWAARASQPAGAEPAGAASGPA
ncbi:class I adenylate-forming enzyme family protein [Jatrophihabitans sp.]|uniref:class I adenylate-forming enzyme family protein n=1 Tax=Jatrophihabitans sp. TaxID=1932789 RepID=UPI002CF617DE|nr:AMP-binding protein [Jatrophihabitans sp.]